MVPVSSTVIPVKDLFKFEKSSSVVLFANLPARNPSYTRSFVFRDKSTKPDTPVRLITKSEFY